MNSEEERIDSKTVQLIHVAKAPLRLSDEVYRGVLQRRYGASSCKDLTQTQGKDLVRYFRRLASYKPDKVTCSLCMPREKGKTIPADAVYPVSPEQIVAIDRLKNAIRWKRSDGYEKWLLKYFALVEIKWSREASVVINALRSLLKSQNKCSSCLGKPKTKGDVGNA